MTFVAGAVIGSLVTWTVVKKKYEQIAQEEIESVKAHFSKREKKEEKTSTDTTEEKRGNLNQYADVLVKNSYAQYSNASKEELVKESERPYVISPEEFGELDDYEMITLIHFSDNVLTDDDGELVENIDETVGNDYASHFGEYEDDSVFVRNDRLGCDYEILFDQRKYSELNHSKYNN